MSKLTQFCKITSNGFDEISIAVDLTDYKLPNEIIGF